jgi:hypothetical protein
MVGQKNMDDLIILEQTFWEKYLKAIGLVKGNINLSDLHKLCDNDPRDHIKTITDLRAIIVAYTQGKAMAAAFFSRDGKPLSLGEMCERSKTHVAQIRNLVKNRIPGALFFLTKFWKYSSLLPLVGNTSHMIREYKDGYTGRAVSAARIA